jgi:enoyl-CoA hydratase/carnithine racemase
MEQAAAVAHVVTVSKETPGVALIHLNRPPANVYNKAFVDDLNAAIDAVRFDEEVTAAVLTSDVPKFFSGGADLKYFTSTSAKTRAMMILHMHEVLLKMERTPKVFIAAISGHATGGGLEIALATDFRFAAEGDYRIGVPEVTLGLLPGNGGTQRLPRLIGSQAAMELLLTGRPVDPATAQEMGIVDRMVPADRLLAECVEFAGALAKGPTVAVGEIKVAAKTGAEMPLEGALTLERSGIFRLFQTEDAKEGMTAFAEKRRPTFKGQ